MYLCALDRTTQCQNSLDGPVVGGGPVHAEDEGVVGAPLQRLRVGRERLYSQQLVRRVDDLWRSERYFWLRRSRKVNMRFVGRGGGKLFNLIIEFPGSLAGQARDHLL